MERTVIVEWPTLIDAQNAYDSDAYQAALDARWQTALIGIFVLLRVLSINSRA